MRCRAATLRRAVLLGVLLCCPLLLGRCDQASVVVITIGTLGQDVRQLRFTATLAGEGGGRVRASRVLPRAAPGPEGERYLIELPDRPRGRLILTVEGLLDGGCVAARGRDEADVAGEPAIERQIDVVPLRERWCWGSVTPPGAAAAESARGGSLARLWGAAADDVWAVGGFGSIAHWDGEDWTPSPSGTTEDLTAVWGTGPDDVWACGGGGTILRWDGHLWARQEPALSAAERARLAGGSLNGIWGPGSGELWLVGDRGVVLRLDRAAGRWRLGDVGTAGYNLTGVWGDGAGRVWTVGAEVIGSGDWGRVLTAGLRGIVAYSDGAAWQVVRAGDGVPALFAVWGSARDDVWAVGFSCRMSECREATLRLRTAWMPAAQSSDRVWLVGLFGRGPGEIWSVGIRTDAKSAEGQQPEGVIRRWQNDRWVAVAELEQEKAGPWTPFSGVWAGATGPVHIIGGGTLLRWEEQGRRLTRLSEPLYDLRGIWGSGPADLWAVGTRGTVLHWDGRRWLADTAATTPDVDLQAVWGSDADNVWAVGASTTSRRGVILHRRGGSWREERPVGGVLTGVRLKGVSGAGGRVFAVGYNGDDRPLAVFGDRATILVRGTGGWSPDEGPLDLQRLDLQAVWAAGPSDAWAVGSLRPTMTNDEPRAVALHRGATGWTAPVQPAGAADLHGVFGLTGNEVWAVGQAKVPAGLQGAVLRFDGVGWAADPATAALLEGTLDLRGLWGAPRADLWLAGNAPPLPGCGFSILRRRGGGWAPIRGRGMKPLTSVWGAGGDVWFVGGRGTILRHTP